MGMMIAKVPYAATSQSTDPLKNIKSSSSSCMITPPPPNPGNTRFPINNLYPQKSRRQRPSNPTRNNKRTRQKRKHQPAILQPRRIRHENTDNVLRAVVANPVKALRSSIQLNAVAGCH
jgi:hypothetical protein